MEGGRFHSRLLENAVSELARLPGIGRKTALRLVLHLLKKEPAEVEMLAASLTELRNQIHHCRICHNISDLETCSICSQNDRDHGTLCVVENIRDVMAIEATHQFKGLYHVLGGILSPMDGIGPADLTIPSLIDRVSAGTVQEVILALSATMEGDTTNFYLYRKLSGYQVKITTLSRGVAIGDDLEFTDELTLGRSIVNRTPFETVLQSK